MKIGIDVDGTVADLGTVWLEWYNRDFKDNLKNDNILSWNTHEYVKPECGRNIYKYLEYPELYDTVKPFKGALNAINMLKIEHRIIFITHSTNGVAGRKFKWLVEHKFLEPIEDYNYIECADKSLINVDFLVDDALHNLKSFPKRRILVERPWNRHIQTNQMFPINGVIYDWNALVYIRDLFRRY